MGMQSSTSAGVHIRQEEQDGNNVHQLSYYSRCIGQLLDIARACGAAAGDNLGRVRERTDASKSVVRVVSLDHDASSCLFDGCSCCCCRGSDVGGG